MNRIVKLIAKPFNLCLSSVFSSCFGRWTNISFVFMLTMTLGFCPLHAQNPSSNNKATDLYSNVQISNEMKYKMPSEYLNKLNDFLKKEYPNMGKGENNTWKYTLDFALKEMESDLSISKEYRWLFVWNVIYYNHTGDYLIDTDDDDSDIMKEFVKFYNEFEACSERYEKGYLSLLEIIGAENQKRIDEAQKQSAENQKRIDEAQKQSAEAQKRIDEAQKRIDEAQKRSAEARQQSAEIIPKIIYSCNVSLATYKELYPFFKEHPGDERLKTFKSNAQELIRLCKKYGVDYKAVLSAEILKFYGMEE